MNKNPSGDAGLERRLRDTLHAVAQTVTTQPHREPVPVATRTPLGRLRRWVLALGALVAIVPVTAGVMIAVGPEYVDEIPPAGVIVSGSLDGERYWMVEPFQALLTLPWVISGLGARVGGRRG